MTIKVIIFDFDGTVADTFDALVTISNNLAPEFGYLPATPEEISTIKDLTTREIIQQSGVAIYKLPFIIRKIIAELNNKIHTLSPVEGIKTALVELKNQGNQLGIITSNDKENVQVFLQNNELLDLFDFIYSGTRIFGKSRVINNFLRQANLRPAEIVYVGDETRDIEAAKKSNIKVIAVSWGFNSRNILKQQKPDFLIEHPQQLVEVIKLLQNPRS
ncbi:HAD-IA family hydrolase [Phormidium sp. LEGE 05292]|uniref:HAD-IA family hydrolase n=1 Tax=[Phormidium] sp. LEGE 05292 TaxID=767427 RepID=UPI00187E4F75|nr:HAD-IA family hydrolase [Phormidium sp. LEGE 05292]MBE9224237.1 HAD-IA family hydrolase [Phormidium sp. LEGE 05292]